MLKAQCRWAFIEHSALSIEPCAFLTRLKAACQIPITSSSVTSGQTGRAGSQVATACLSDRLGRRHSPPLTIATVVDRDSVEALKEAEQARRVAAQSIQQGESTLAAYRRVVSPGLTPATLVNRRG